MDLHLYLSSGNKLIFLQRGRMRAFRVLTVDNEAIARRQLHDLLSLDPECELIGECSTAAQAVCSVDRSRPDIVFADVPVPEMDAFEMLRSISGRRPLVILTSGEGDCTVRGFDTWAFDYLLKPFDQTRFHDSLSRAKSVIAGAARAVQWGRPPQTPERIAVRQNGRILFITLAEIDWIEAADNYVCLHCGAATHMLRETMSEVEARLPEARFVRIHRSAIVNIDRIKELQPWFRGDYQVILLGGTRLTLTKSHRRKLDSQLLLGPFTR
jgi:two-component system LytT family response regulator